MVAGAARALEPHRVAFWLSELAGLFHPYYKAHRVIQDDRAPDARALRALRGRRAGRAERARPARRERAGEHVRATTPRRGGKVAPRKRKRRLGTFLFFVGLLAVLGGTFAVGALAGRFSLRPSASVGEREDAWSARRSRRRRRSPS